MKVGLIGVGMVGGTLRRWFEDHTDFKIAAYDPPKGMRDDLTGCDAIFISIPVDSCEYGQNLKQITDAVFMAKKYCPNVYIRSTVLPGTNDSLGTISMPEFLTARRAYQDMCKLPIISGTRNVELTKNLFPDKEIIFVSNNEAELSKFTHNIFGALKVTYFNMIKRLSTFHGADFEKVKKAANITGYLGEEHMQVPGHDGKLGYGGTCFPVNMSALESHLAVITNHRSFTENFSGEAKLIQMIRSLNVFYRGAEK